MRFGAVATPISRQPHQEGGALRGRRAVGRLHRLERHRCSHPTDAGRVEADRPVRERVSAALFERFRAPANRFFERRQEFLPPARNDDKRCWAGCARCARRPRRCGLHRLGGDGGEDESLQAEAQAPGPPTRARATRARGKAATDVLHQRFQLACDRVFDRYRRRDEVEVEGTLAAAGHDPGRPESLRASLAGPDAPPAEHVTERLTDRLAEWRRIGPMPPDRARALHQRLQASCDAIEAAYPDGLPKTRSPPRAASSSAKSSAPDSSGWWRP